MFIFSTAVPCFDWIGFGGVTDTQTNQLFAQPCYSKKSPYFKSLWKSKISLFWVRLKYDDANVFKKSARPRSCSVL